MSKTLRAFCLACTLVVLTPALADYAQLEASVVGVASQTVTVAVHNPVNGPVSARVRVVVRFDNDSYFVLTSGNFTVAAGSTSSISLSAPQSVAEIEDNPEPFPVTP